MSAAEPAIAAGRPGESDGAFLLVEDNDDHAQLMVQMLRRAHATRPIRRVADGAAALAYLRGEFPYETAARPGLIVLDLNLPKVDGLEVLRHVKLDPVLRAIPVVMFTSSDEETDRALAYENYANSYVLKPGDIGQLRRLVDDLARYWVEWNRPAPVC